MLTLFIAYSLIKELGLDWNICAHMSLASLASHLLLLYGTKEQKSIYLPKIASGECKPAIMNVEYNKLVSFFLLVVLVPKIWLQKLSETLEALPI